MQAPVHAPMQMPPRDHGSPLRRRRGGAVFVDWDPGDSLAITGRMKADQTQILIQRLDGTPAWGLGLGGRKRRSTTLL